jgi:hypothetical protein
MNLDRSALLALTGVRSVERLDLPEGFNGSEEPQTVFIRSMSQADREELRVLLKGSEASGPEKIAVRVLCDESGELLFKRSEWPLLKDMPAKVMEMIVEASTVSSSLTEEERKVIRKNFKVRS